MFDESSAFAQPAGQPAMPMQAQQPMLDPTAEAQKQKLMQALAKMGGSGSIGGGMAGNQYVPPTAAGIGAGALGSLTPAISQVLKNPDTNGFVKLAGLFGG